MMDMILNAVQNDGKNGKFKKIWTYTFFKFR